MIPSSSRIVIGTAVAMIAFAANSVLNRLALSGGHVDAASYTGLRLASGAVMLALLLGWRTGWHRRPVGGGIWPAVALFLYAIGFSIAYLRLEAGSGALILFAAVQIGMLGWAISQGERPGMLETAGFALAILSLIALLLPGATAPDPGGAALMVVAGLSWAAYTLMGRGSAAPLTDTAGNFIRCLPIGILLILPGAFFQTISLQGWAYAIASGALASGLGYALWYSVLPALQRSTAAYVQLSVPAIAALGGVLFIAEPISWRLVICSAGILGGVALALWGAGRRRPAPGGNSPRR